MDFKILFCVFLLSFTLYSQSTSQEQQIKLFYEQALTEGKAYDWLDHLSNKIGDVSRVL